MSLKIIKGIGTIVWGAGSILAAPAGAIVDSLQLTPKNAEPIEIEDSDGLCAFEVLLRDGFNGKASVLYDATKVWPVEGANVGLAVPYNTNANTALFGEGSANAGTAVTANGVTTYTCLVASVSPAYKKKGEAMVDLSLTYRPGVPV